MAYHKYIINNVYGMIITFRNFFLVCEKSKHSNYVTDFITSIKYSKVYLKE